MKEEQVVEMTKLYAKWKLIDLLELIREEMNSLPWHSTGNDLGPCILLDDIDSLFNEWKQQSNSN